MASYIKKNRIVLLITGIVLVGLSVLLSSHEKMKDITKTDPIKTSRSIIPPHKGNMQPDFDFGKFPLYFIKNQGQFNQKARFYVKTSHCTLWVTQEGLVFDRIKEVEKTHPDPSGHPSREQHTPSALRGHPSQEGNNPGFPNSPYSTKIHREVSRFVFLNANKNPDIVPINQAKLKVNYFKGNDRSKWVCDVPTSLGVLYKNLYNNIDLKVYGIEKQVEYDWIVRPGGNPEDIRFHLKNIKSISIDREGNLLIESSLGKEKHKKPAAFQMIKNKKVKIKSQFKRIGKGKNIYGFFIGTYDKNHELIIDPVYLSYSTYLGGSSEDRAYDIAVDSGGNYVYVTGVTWSANFPTLNQYQGNQSSTDAFITKIDTSQSGSSSLLYSSYLGGNGTDTGWGIAADSSGIAYITGTTGSSDFPTLNQYQSNQSQDDVFVTKIDTTQSGSSSLLYSTYLGGNSYDQGYGIAIDSSSNAYVSGTTNSTDFPTLNQYQTDQSYTDIFVTKLDTTQSGSSCLVYSTYLGGSYYDFGNGIALDSSGYVYVIGETWSSNFPLLNQYQGYQGMTDAVISKLDTSQSGSSSLLYSTYLGGAVMITAVI
jgi:hypothetical protein